MPLERLSNEDRVAQIEHLQTEGFVILPVKLDTDRIQTLIAAIDRCTHEVRGENVRRSVKRQNCVDLDPAFRSLMMYEPALQLAYDCFGPMFHLCQSNFVSRPDDGTGLADYLSASPWHADGPRPGLFPQVGGAMGLHYLKFGYFLTDLRHGNGGSLQVIRRSHLRPELDRIPGHLFRIEDYADDLVQFDCEPGTVVAFHQAQWHAAPPNQSAVERKNLYISYCPTWMRPLDREFPTEESLNGYTKEESWLLGEPRPAQQWWLPSREDLTRMGRFKRDSEATIEDIRRFD